MKNRGARVAKSTGIGSKLSQPSQANLDQAIAGRWMYMKIKVGEPQIAVFYCWRISHYCGLITGAFAFQSDWARLELGF